MTLGNPDRPVGGLAVPTPAGIELRPLGRDDFTDALRLARELYGLDADADVEPHRAPYESLVNDVDATPFLALAEGEAVGLIVHRLRRRLNHATFEGWISDLVVREPFRGRGIGSALLQHCIELAHERDCGRVEWTCLDWNTRAQCVYENLGARRMSEWYLYRLTRDRIQELAQPPAL